MKGIAIQTILLLLVGILVVGIIVYLVYSYTRSSTLSKTECLSIVTNWCTTCMVSNWNENIDCPQDVKDCGKMLLNNDWWDNNDDCAHGTDLDAIKTDCRVTTGVG